MKVWGLVVAASIVLISTAGCSSNPPVLPDRAAPAVKAEEARLVALLSADRTVLGERGVCTVRLLGQREGASFMWAQCQALDSQHATSLPLRVDGSKVTRPGDGEAYGETVREMFPEDLAEFVLNNHDSPELRPSVAATSAAGG